MPDEIKRLTSRYMVDPLHLNMSPSVLTVDKIRQTYITVEKEQKFDLLLKVIEREQPKPVRHLRRAEACGPTPCCGR